MLETLGYGSVEELVDAAVPPVIRQERPLDLPAPLTEAAALEQLREIADRLPLALANQAVREPWLGIGNATGALLTTLAIAAVAATLAARRTAL